MDLIASGSISSTYYYADDFLGSSRTMVQAGGTAPCFDADFLPFGREKDNITTCTQNDYKFEGKERDTETGNDDFGARYYSSNFGRWLSPDWSSIPEPVPYANLTNPQTLNLYAMVQDNPESFADLDGHVNTPGSANQWVTCDVTDMYGCNDEEQAQIWNNALSAAPMKPDVLAAYINEHDAAGYPYALTFTPGPAISVAKCLKDVGTCQQYALHAYFALIGPGSELAAILDLINPARPGPITSPSDPLGQCVTACRHYAKGLPDHTKWLKGGPVVISINGVLTVNPTIAKGTAIATFVGDHYPGSDDPHKNSGIFLGPAVIGPPGSIRILDQWPGSPGPRPRDMSPNGGFGPGDRSNHSTAYSVIMTP